MSLVQLVLVLAILGFILYLVNTFIPMPAPIKTAINVLVVIVLVLWLLDVFGIGNFPVIHR